MLGWLHQAKIASWDFLKGFNSYLGKTKFMHKAVCLAAIIILQAMASGAILHGTVYDSDTLDTVDKAIVRVDTSPEQLMVAENGEYSFFLPNGNYTIKAQSGQLEASEGIIIEGDGNFTLDLLLFPSDDFFPPDENLSEELIGKELEEELPAGIVSNATPPAREETGLIPILQTIIMVLAFAALLYLFWKKRQPEKHVEKKGEIGKTRKPARVAPKTIVLEPEQKEALKLLKISGGAITQKDLRAKMPYSEAKVSLIVTELEGMGLARRFKQGRGNIIKLVKG